MIGDEVRLRGDLALCFHNALAWDFHVIAKRSIHGQGLDSQLFYFFEHLGISSGHASALASAWLLAVIAVNVVEMDKNTDTEVAALQLATRTWGISISIYGAYYIAEAAQCVTQFTPLNFTAESIFCLTFLGLWRALYWQWSRGLL